MSWTNFNLIESWREVHKHTVWICMMEATIFMFHQQNMQMTENN